MTTTYDIGDVARVSVAFTDALGAAADPTAVTCKVKNPNGVISTYTWALGTVTRSGLGAFYKDVSITMSGEWFYRFEGTGTVESASESYFIASDSEFD